jgi:putative spermidine/putrescine transport system ATP-binding protein
MTVADNVAFGLERKRLPKGEVKTRVAEILELVDLAGHEARKPRQLSGGQQQRVALARALVFQPQALLMDEPLGALDKRLREQLQVEIKRLHRELGTTFVFVTHDQEEALAMSDRIAVLRDGQLVQVGTPVELYERPSSRYVAEFLGESNIFTGACARGRFVDETTGATFAVADHHVGDALVVRPEHVSLAAIGDTLAANHNAVTGRTREVTYLGAGLRVDLDLPDGRRVIARTGTRDTHVPQVGDSVVAHWHADHALAVTDDVEPADASTAA